MKKVVNHIFTAEQSPVGAKIVVEFLSLLDRLNGDHIKHSVLIKVSPNEQYKEQINTYITNNSIKVNVSFYKSYASLLKSILNTHHKVILHELTTNRLALQLLLNPSLCHRCSWVIWGGDLYHYAFFGLDFSSLKRFVINFFIRRPVIRRFNKVICLRQDFDLAKTMYELDENFLLGLYPVKYEEHAIIKEGSKKDLPRIMVGHSASSNNNHSSIFEMLRTKHNQDFYVICPLSYGDLIYRETVLAEGFLIFGDYFLPILEHMDLTDYQKFIGTIDVLIFDAPRQQGIGNLMLAIRSLKKIYMRPETTPFQWLRDCGVLLSSVYDLPKADLEEILNHDVSSAVSNKTALEKIYNDDNIAKIWVDVFNAC